METKPSNEPIFSPSVNENDLPFDEATATRMDPGKQKRRVSILLLLIIANLFACIIVYGIKTAGWNSNNLGSRDNRYSDPFGQVVIDAEDRVWTLDGDDNLVSLNPGDELEVWKGLNGKYIYDFKADPTGNLWVSTRSGLYLLSPDGTQTLELGNTDSFRLQFDPKGRLWVTIASDSGGDKISDYIIVRELDNSWTRYNPPEDDNMSEGDIIMGISFDEEGNAWILTQQLMKLDPNGNWKTFSTSIVAYPRKIIMDTDRGWVWVVGYGASRSIIQISIHDLNGEKIKSLPSEGNLPLAGNQIYTSLRDKDGRIWFGTNGGLNLFDTDGTWRTYSPINSGLPGINVSGLNSDSEGNIWVRTESNSGNIRLSSFDSGKISRGNVILIQYLMIFLPILLLIFISSEIYAIRELRALEGQLAGSNLSSKRSNEKMASPPSKSAEKKLPDPSEKTESFTVMIKSKDFLFGLFGWYIANLIFWLLMTEGTLDTSAGAEGALFFVGLCILPATVIVLPILMIIKFTRKFALGAGLAIVVNVAIGLMLDPTMGAANYFVLPFFLYFFS